MLRELINFTDSLSEEFKNLGTTPKEGLHIILKIDAEDNSILNEIPEFDFYDKKMKDNISPFLHKCIQFQENAWCVNTNKCYDLPKKAIHTCSPFSIAFKREHLKNGTKFLANEEKNEVQIYDRFDGYYFSKAKETIDEQDEVSWKAFRAISDFFISGNWENLFENIKNKREEKFNSLLEREDFLKEKSKEEKDKQIKANLKEQIDDLQEEKRKFRSVSDSDYILFYLDLPVELYKKSHQKYLGDNLFNTADYNIESTKDGVIYGTNDFQNGFNSKMPFLLHQTATFDITGRISNLDAKILYEFSKVLPKKTLPNPLPIFIYNDEFTKKVLSLHKEGKLGFRDLVNSLYQSYKEDFQNYYLLNWNNTKNGIVFNDFDFISKFQYFINDEKSLRIHNYFELLEKGKGEKKYAEIKTVFELEDRVLKYLIQNKYQRVDYFSDLEKKDYENRDFTFLSFSKYRKAIYDYVYKSNKNAISGGIFDELIFNAIQDDLKNSNEYGIKEKLNIWYSLHHYFHKNQNKNYMGSQLESYQNFVAALIEDNAEITNATDEQFAFAAGQVIYYLLNKSKSDDTSFRLLEPYLQKTKIQSLQENIADDFARYKHENFSKNFTKVAAFVLSYQSMANMKKLQPQLLSGLFAKNQLFSK